VSHRSLLVELARAVAPDQTVSIPAGWLLEALGDAEQRAITPAIITIDLTLAEVAAKFGRKSPSTVRLWCEKGWLPGAYRLHGREWRVPLAAVGALQERHRERGRRLAPQASPPPATGSLSDWRKVSGGSPA
jgi:hypothetical protein